ncbi:MAG: hypothetical protein FJ013_02295 [Chloroflexi bacterium]|nr:hypothetical protein [Chloroflexota bacterium]
MSSPHFLDIFFYPTSVAVVGASREPMSVNYRLVDNLVKLGFKGNIFPVNPNADEIVGLKAYASLRDIGAEVDLVVSAVPARMTLDVMKECVDKRVGGVVVVSGGFSDAGELGGKEQSEMARLLKENGIRAVGPNALSPINSENNLVISFLPARKIIAGGVSLVFQSGFYDPRLNWIFCDFHLGVNKLLDLGNKMDINEVDALEYLAGDDSTKAIAIHIETVKGDGKRFVQILKDTTRVKPVVVLKSGRSVAGAKAAASHTGSVARESDIVFDALLKQCGAIRAHTVEEFFDFAKAVGFLAPPRGNGIVIASLSGGEGVIAIDAAQQHGFSLAKPGSNAYAKMKAVFPPWEIPLNSFDLGVCAQFHGWRGLYDVLFESMIGDAGVDCMVVGLPPLGMMFDPETACKPFLLGKDARIPVAVWRLAPDKSLDAFIEALESNNVPVYPSAERAIKALSVVYRYHNWRRAAG